MKRGLKYLLVGLGMAIKLWGIPQNAQCPTSKEILYQKLSQYSTNYNTINIKNYNFFYSPCKENK